MKRLSSKLIMLTFALITILGACKKENSIVDIKPNDFLSDEKYQRLDVEVVAVAGFEPDAEALNNLKSFLETRLNKPGGIHFSQRTISSPSNYSYTAEDLRNLEDETRKEYAEDENLAAYIFYADQGYSEDTESSTVLGVAYSSTSMCIFKESVSDNSGGLGEVSEENLESAVLIHEFGHVLGLVNTGTPMTQNHEDPGRPAHCDNEDCLMYYASETSDMLGIFGGGSIPTLDDQCIDDLQANGGK